MFIIQWVTGFKCRLQMTLRSYFQNQMSESNDITFLQMSPTTDILYLHAT